MRHRERCTFDGVTYAVSVKDTAQGEWALTVERPDGEKRRLAIRPDELAGMSDFYICVQELVERMEGHEVELG